MPLFKCSACACVENTALCRYWPRMGKREAALCSECDPAIKKWHGEFPRERVNVEGYKLGNDGFLYHPKALARGAHQHQLEHYLVIVGDA